MKLERIFNKRNNVILCVLILFFITQFATYYFATRNNPKDILLIDLVSINQSFVEKIARESMPGNNNFNYQITTASYLKELNVIIRNFEDKGYVLLQKQAVIASHYSDITQDVEKILLDKFRNNKSKKDAVK